MTKKSSAPKQTFNRKHLLWTVPIATILLIAAGVAISVWRDYEDDRDHFSSVVESNQQLVDTISPFVNDGVSIVGARDYCTYSQGKYGREGNPRCGREITLRVTDSSKRGDVAERLSVKMRALSSTYNSQNTELYKRECGVYSNSPDENVLVARCFQAMKRWAMYPDFPDRTYN